MSIAAEGGATPPTVPDAAARVLEFTQVARPEDVPLILKALSTTELNAGIVRLGLRLPEAVIDHVVVQGPPAARTTPAWQLRLPPSRPAAVRRTSLARGYDDDRVRDHAVTVPDPDQCYDPHPDDPAHWPLENAVRQHLDNRPHRWRIMVRRLMEAGPLEYAQLVDLVQTVGGAGEPSKGEP